MSNPLGPSWKPRIAGILTIAGGLINLAIDGFMNGHLSNEAIGVAITAVITGVGLYQAKQHDVSNSPTPLGGRAAGDRNNRTP